MDKIYLSPQTTITITILIGLFFIGLGYFNNKKILNVTNTYDDKFFNKTKYFSDSRGQFNYGNPLDSDEFKKGLNIQLLTHPIWWIGDGNNVNERLKWFKKHKIDMIEKSLSDNLDFYGK